MKNRLTASFTTLFTTPLTIVTAGVVATFLVSLLSLAYADSDPVLGIWKTEPGDSGGYLHVEIAACEDQVCGTIARAFNEKHEEGKDYEHLGKSMITGMRKKAPGDYVKGKIWAPDKDKTYNAKMKIDDGQLLVSGCVAFICRSQVWTRVE